MNLYGMAGNNAVGDWDYLGLEKGWIDQLGDWLDKNFVAPGVPGGAGGVMDREINKPKPQDPDDYDSAEDNCYTWACGVPADVDDDRHDWKPGGRKGVFPWEPGQKENKEDPCKHIANKVAVDNHVENVKEDGSCPCGYRKIRLYYGALDYYHFMRQKSDGSWDGKMGRNSNAGISSVMGPKGAVTEQEVDRWVEGIEMFDFKSCNKSMCIKPRE